MAKDSGARPRGRSSKIAPGQVSRYIGTAVGLTLAFSVAVALWQVLSLSVLAGFAQSMGRSDLYLLFGETLREFDLWPHGHWLLALWLALCGPLACWVFDQRAQYPDRWPVRAMLAALGVGTFAVLGFEHPTAATLVPGIPPRAYFVFTAAVLVAPRCQNWARYLLLPLAAGALALPMEGKAMVPYVLDGERLPAVLALAYAVARLVPVVLVSALGAFFLASLERLFPNKFRF